MSQRPGPGRPPSPDAATVPIVVRVTPGQAKQLNAVARLNGTTRSEFIREAVSEAVADCSDAPVFSRAK